MISKVVVLFGCRENLFELLVKAFRLRYGSVWLPRKEIEVVLNLVD